MFSEQPSLVSGLLAEFTIGKFMLTRELKMNSKSVSPPATSLIPIQLSVTIHLGLPFMDSDSFDMDPMPQARNMERDSKKKEFWEYI